MRSGLGVRSWARICSPLGNFSALSQPQPARPVSSDRSAFWKDSLNVRPIAIASPTDFIWVVSTGSEPGNFSKAKRGIFVTT